MDPRRTPLHPPMTCSLAFQNHQSGIGHSITSRLTLLLDGVRFPKLQCPPIFGPSSLPFPIVLLPHYSTSSSSRSKTTFPPSSISTPLLFLSPASKLAQQSPSPLLSLLFSHLNHSTNPSINHTTE